MNGQKPVEMNENIVTYEDISINNQDWWMNEVGDQFSLAQFQVDLDSFESQKILKKGPENNIGPIPSVIVNPSEDYSLADSLSMNNIDEIMKNFIGTIPSGESENIMVDIGQMSYGTYDEKMNISNENVATPNYFDMKSERENKYFENYTDSMDDFSRQSVVNKNFDSQDDIVDFSICKTDNSNANGFCHSKIKPSNGPASSGGRIIYNDQTPSNSIAIPRLEFSSANIVDDKHEQNVQPYEMDTLSPPSLDSICLGSSPRQVSSSPYRTSSSPYRTPRSPYRTSRSPCPTSPYGTPRSPYHISISSPQIPTTILNGMCSTSSTISECSETGTECENKKVKRLRRGQPRKEKLYNFSTPFDDPTKEKRRLDAIKSHDAREKEKKLKRVMSDQITALEKALEEKDAMIKQKDALMESKEAVLERYKKALKEFVTLHKFYQQKIDHNDLTDLIS